MAVTSYAIANELLRLVGEQDKQLTNMQLQKLVFLAHGYCLAVLGRPLHFHNTHAWQWGPVIPKLYKALQRYGSDFVTEPLQTNDAVNPDSEEAEIIQAVLDQYGHYTGGQLSALTHRPNTPWSQTWAREKFAVIDNELIRRYYRRLIEAA